MSRTGNLARGRRGGRWIVAVMAVLALSACTRPDRNVAEPTTARATNSTAAVTAATAPVQPTSAPAPAPPTMVPPTTARARSRQVDPATVIRRFYAAINRQDYRAAWALGGKNLGNRSYEEFVAGFADTDHDELRITRVRGQSVDVVLTATQDGGTRQTIYAGTYQVVNGAITHGRLRVVDQSGGEQTGACDPAYPNSCIPPPPPDLDCADIGRHDFTVRQPDPHHFDADKDGVGCESRRS
jgi:hypothetical protein